MNGLRILMFLLGLSAPFSASALDAQWKFFKLAKTTEKSVVSVYGAPDYIEVQSNYETLRAAKEGRKTDLLSSYELIYSRMRGDLNILKGPLGEATATNVLINAGKVKAVHWEYSVKYKVQAETLWRNDKSIKTKVVGAIIVGSKTLADKSILIVTCSTGKNFVCDGAIQVDLNLNTNEK